MGNIYEEAYQYYIDKGLSEEDAKYCVDILREDEVEKLDEAGAFGAIRALGRFVGGRPNAIMLGRMYKNMGQGLSPAMTRRVGGRVLNTKNIMTPRAPAAKAVRTFGQSKMTPKQQAAYDAAKAKVTAKDAKLSAAKSERLAKAKVERQQTAARQETSAAIRSQDTAAVRSTPKVGGPAGGYQPGAKPSAANAAAQPLLSRRSARASQILQQPRGTSGRDAGDVARRNLTSTTGDAGITARRRLRSRSTDSNLPSNTSGLNPTPSRTGKPSLEAQSRREIPTSSRTASQRKETKGDNQRSKEFFNKVKGAMSNVKVPAGAVRDAAVFGTAGLGVAAASHNRHSDVEDRKKGNKR